MQENERSVTKRIPYNLEAEKAVLGACLIDSLMAGSMQEKLKRQDFYAPQHQLIYGAIINLQNENKPCDPITVGNILKESGDLDACGGMAYLSGLLDAVPAPSAAAHYADIILENAQIRALMDALSSVMSNVSSGGMSARELIDVAEKAVFDISQERRKGDLVALSDLLADVYVQMSNIKASSGVTGVPTFKDLDGYLSGLQKGDLVILAARPGCGKTSMAVNIAQNSAVRHGRVAAIFSLEMPKEQLVQRMLCTQAAVDHSRVRKGMASKSDFKRLQNAVAELSKARIFIDDSMSITVSEMRSKCRKLKMDQGLDLIVVDYIQLMHSVSGRKTENRQLEVAEISRSLKELAKDLNVPILALSQLSRQAEGTKEPPGLAHLRESGALEQDADVVLMLHRPKTAETDEDSDDESSWKSSDQGEQVQVIIAKHRNGPTGTVDMLFVRQYTAFHDNAQSWVGDYGAPPPADVELPPVDDFDIF